MKNRFGIKILSEMSGVSEHTIRAWEKRYGALKPLRSAGGHRLYHDTDINRLSALKLLVETGYQISHIANWSSNQLIRMAGLNPHGTKLSKPKADCSKHLSGIILALKSLQLPILEHEMLLARRQLPVDDFILKLVLPCMVQVGNLFAKGELDIAQEHMISALIKSYLYPFIGKKSEYHKEEVLLLTPEGEWHEIGVLSAAALLSERGIKCTYLGANMPAASIINLAQSLPITKIFIGVSDYTITSNTKLNRFFKTLNKLPPHIEIYTGGFNYTLFSHIPKGDQINYLKSLTAILELF